ncbi:MAG: hypothetical protein HKN82_01335 [Akkermansiaceae bacterium]|nr:hypothetical protein [Akkermansiaceae bacterium]NNM31024.1 hypothetical protein [Akkermansiaceae bacterium]
MKQLFLPCAVVLAILPATAGAQQDTAHHRAAYAEINDNQKSYRYVKATLDDEHAEVKIEGWYDGRTLRKILATIPGEHGLGVEEYYLEAGAPLFVYTKYDTRDMQSGKVVAVVEDRYYFRDGALFKWLDHEKKQVAPGSAEFDEGARTVKSDCSLYISALGDAHAPDPGTREPTEEELHEFGVVRKVEDAGYPMLAVDMIFGKGRVEGDFLLNAEAVGVTEADLKAIENGKAVQFYYTADEQNSLQDIRVGGKSLLGEYAPKLHPEWKKITGTLRGAGEETAGDLPDEITVTSGDGATLVFETFIDPAMVAANGKTVTVYYEPRFMHTITYLKLPGE